MSEATRPSNKTKVSFDFETYSECDLMKCGAWVYAEHPTTEALCMAYAYDNGAPHLWLPGDPLPDFVTHPERYTLHAWNAFFEWCIWTLCLRWPETQHDQWYDTMAKAAAMALPLSLEKCGKALKMPSDLQKDKRGKYLIQRLCSPFRGKRNRDMVLLLEFYEYCKQDVVAERAIGDMLLPLCSSERALWVKDWEINIRGACIDLDAVNHARVIIDKETETLNTEVADITNGALLDVAKRDRVMVYCRDEHGFRLTGYAKDYLEKILQRDDVPPVVRRLLEIRQQTGKTSNAKYEALSRMTASDRRVHGLLQYHAAGTGRWGGRLFQPQNLPRPSFNDADTAVSLFHFRDPELLRLLFDDPLEALSSSLRGMITPSPGNKFIVSDYNAIEGRVLAWLADEAHTLQDYRDGKDQYKVCATWMFNKPYDAITKDERQAGKPADLGLGYGGGISAFDQFAKVYQVDYDRLSDNLRPNATNTEVEKAEFSARMYLQNTDEPMPAHHAIAADLAKQKWRANRPATVEFWAALEQAALSAVREPGSRFDVGRITFMIPKGAPDYLMCRLPSGRCLTYAKPTIKPGRFGNPALHYMGQNSVTKKWELQQTYGGKLGENATQAVARDLLADAIMRVEDAGYPVVLTVHDEIIADTPDRATYNVSDFNRLLCVLPEWASGLPVKAAGYEAHRYRKD